MKKSACNHSHNQASEPVHVNLKKYFFYLIIFRLLNIFLNQTWFVPDEFWQSQEVAHHIAFKYGYLTWEWQEGIRSYIYPLFIAFFYKILELLNLDNTFLLVYIVPIIHAFGSAFADLMFFKFVEEFYGKNIAIKALYCRIISWFTMYMSTRSLTNNIEEMFTIFCLVNLNKPSININKTNKHNYWVLHICGFLSFFIRNTSAINLIPIYVYQFFHVCNTNYSKFKFFYQFILIGTSILLFNIAIDSYFHGGLLVSAYQFLLYNVIHNVGIHYGTHPIHWYLTQGYPIILFTHSSIFFIGLKYIKKLLFPFGAILFNILIYSLLSHKEFRFLNQIMPFSMIICAFGLHYIDYNYKKKIYKLVNIFLMVSNFLMIITVGLIHLRGPILLMKHLRSDKTLSQSDSILFLTPCHSTPYYSYLHRNVSMRFLTCEPNVDKTIRSYQDEADKFDSNPTVWFVENKKEIEEFTRLVLFENLLKRLKKNRRVHSEALKFFDKYDIEEEFFHSFIEQSERVGKKLLLMKLRNSGSNNGKPFTGEYKRNEL